MQTIVIGHKNPDMDSICSALAYARLKQLLGMTDVVAARAGNTNARIDYVLKRFGVEAPVFLSDVAPKVSDVMQREGAWVHSDSAVYDAIQLIDDKQLRGLPVVDDKRHCVGLLSTFKLNRHLFPSREDASKARIITASLRGIVETFGGSVVAGEITSETKDYLLMVAAMSEEKFSLRLEGHDVRTIVLFVGDRTNIHFCAIRAKVRAIVVTGGLLVPAHVEKAALEAGVAIISSPHDTATSVLLSRGAVRVGRMVEAFTSFGPETPLEIARERAAASAASVFPVIAEDGVLVGLLNKSDFIKPIPRKLILVDHNELSQAVPGADKIPILEILDHHRIGGFASETPIHFWNNPVGSTCTIVSLCYEQMGVALTPDTAGLLMAGILADTLNLTSPTTTPVDKRIIARLSALTGVDPSELAAQIFSVGSPLLTMPAAKVITTDCKEYDEHGQRFTVSQIEELDISQFQEKRATLLEALEQHQRRQGLLFAALMVTDVNTQNSLLLVCGAPAFLARLAFPSHGPHVWELAGMVSRKKQLLPYLLKCLSDVSSPLLADTNGIAFSRARLK